MVMILILLVLVLIWAYKLDKEIDQLKKEQHRFKYTIEWSELHQYFQWKVWLVSDLTKTRRGEDLEERDAKRKVRRAIRDLYDETMFGPNGMVGEICL